jgi:protein-tyrosine phosphatase
MSQSPSLDAAETWQPNLTWITDRLAVGGSFPAEQAETLAKVHGIHTVVDLRTEACDDEAVLQRHNITFLHLPTDDHCGVSPAMLRDGVDFVNRHIDRGEPVLVHCEHGIGRSATLALCVLVSRGMEPLEALELAKSRRSLVSPSPAQFQAWTGWLRDWARDHPVSWRLPGFDAFKAIAYRHLQVQSR